MAEKLTQTIGAKSYSLSQLREMAQESKRKSSERSLHPPVVQSAECDPQHGVTLTFSTGCQVLIPMEEFHELRGATPEELRDVKLLGAAAYLEWPQLDMLFDIRQRLMDLLGLTINDQPPVNQEVQTAAGVTAASQRPPRGMDRRLQRITAIRKAKGRLKAPELTQERDKSRKAAVIPGRKATASEVTDSHSRN